MNNFYNSNKDVIYANSCNIDIGVALQILTPNANWTCVGDIYDGITWLDEINKKPSREDVDKTLDMLSKCKKYHEIILKRNDLLQKTDKCMLQDFPITQEQRDQCAKYRQLLRDLPSKENYEEMYLQIHEILHT